VTKQNGEIIKEKLVSLTRDLMLIPTTASRPAEIERGFQLIKNHLENIKTVEIKEYEDQGNPSMVVTPKGVKNPKILICAHIDVVDYPSPSAFQSKIKAGKIIGPGGGDMKGSLAIGLEIFRHFHLNHADVSLGLAITSDEEMGGTSGIGFFGGEKEVNMRYRAGPGWRIFNKNYNA